MNNERTVFSVTPEAVYATQQQVRAFGSFLLSRHAWEHFNSTQPALVAYATEVASAESIDSETYASGVVNAYINVVNQLDLDGEMKHITPDDIGLHSYNIADYHLFENVPEEPQNLSDDLSEVFADQGLNRFLDKLFDSSPEFAEIVCDHLANACSSVAERKSFLRGIYDIFMPFYTKREAEYMHDYLIWLPSLRSAVKGGYYSFDVETDETKKP